MARRLQTGTAIIGVADHWGWAILMTIGPDTTLLDRRRVALVDDGLPQFPHHHEAQGLPASEAEALVERVRRSAEACAQACLDALAAALSMKVAGIALRTCPPLPETVAERLSNYRAQNVADSVMYREALAQAATARGWFVHWYDARRVFSEAANVLDGTTIDEVFARARAALGPPWQKDHKLAMAAAIAASAE